MKKLFTTLTVFAALSLSAQELITNGGLEEWTDGAPNGWTISISNNGGSIVQDDEVHSGISSAQFTAPLGTGNNKMALADFDVVAGTTYTFSYWYKDESVDARLRHWASWRDAGGAQLDNNLDVLQPAEYNADTNDWQMVTLSVTAPANAAKFRLDFRVYREGDTGGGEIHLDDVSFMGPNMSVSDVNNFANGVKMNTIVTNKLTLQLPERATVNIYTMEGKLVSSNRVDNGGSIETSSLAKGVYVVKVTNGYATTTHKIVKK